MTRHFSHPQKGSLILVVLCLLTVLGIGLAAYLAVAKQSMTLSNRAQQTGLSAQLAEMGLEEALRAFNKNLLSGTDTTAALADWSSGGTAVDWTLDTTNKRATASLTFPTTKFGQGIIGSVKIRIDNYNANQLNSTWSSSANYRINDLVGYNGIWYRAVQNHSNQTPGNLAYWVQAPIPWTWSSNNTYAQYDIVNYNGTWYRYISTTSGSGTTPSNGTTWYTIPSISLAWSSGVTYSSGAMVFDNGTWYYCYLSHTSSGSITISNTAYWAPLPAPSDTWANSSNYVVGDYVYYSGVWYRCTSAHTSSGANRPPSASWTTNSIPYISWAWRSGITYSFNDRVFYSASGSGTWYRCKIASATSVPTTSSDWEDALTGSMYAWSSSSINYNLGDAVYYSTTSQWYRCILAHTSSGSITPSSTTYWTNTPRKSNAWDSGKNYSSYDTVNYNGVWYLSLQNSNVGQNPATAASYWGSASNSIYYWNSATAYTFGGYRSYGGTWYTCILDNTNQTPNNSTYWTAVGAPVIYAEGTTTLPDGSAPIKTQLRATIAPAPLFPNAAAATNTLTISTATGTVDSYDGSVNAITPQGTYTTYTYHQITSPFSASPNWNSGYSAVLAAGSTLAINGTTAVSGYLAWPSPPSGISSGTTVKSATSPASPKVDPSRVSRSPYIPQFDTLPSGGLAAAFTASNFPKGMALALSATTNIGTLGATTPSRYYYDGDLIIDSAHSITTLNINGPVILYINGNLTIDGSTSNLITISSAGSAEIHVAKSLKVNLAGNGFNNTTLDPKKLILICDSATSATQNYSDGSNPFYGAIYVPYTTATSGLVLDSSSTIQVYGALSAAKITYSGVPTVIHYDTSLRYATFGGVDQPYAITEWRELTDPAERAVLP